jgi:hypothetical protein
MKLTMPRFRFVRMVKPKQDDSRRSNALMLQVTNPTARSTSSSRSWHTHVQSKKTRNLSNASTWSFNPKHAQPLGEPLVFMFPRQQQPHQAQPN